ncbi:MAG: hypothetical protein GC179_15570 [Anaerolineaceae bacterium]|nr:hypothetical protein [Anaerolineaceae bacterium]
MVETRKLAIKAIVTLLTLSMTLTVLAQATPTLTPDDSNVLADCIKLLPADRPVESGENAPSVRIVEPTSDVVYGSAVTIQIQTNNFDVNANGQHWHLWVNGTLTGMVYQPNAVIDLAPGDYTICASLGNSTHADIGMPDGIRLRVEAAQVGTPTATLAVDRSAAQVQPEGQISSSQIVLLIGGGLLAAVGGWWIGNRMPKGKKK